MGLMQHSFCSEAEYKFESETVPAGGHVHVCQLDGQHFVHFGFQPPRPLPLLFSSFFQKGCYQRSLTRAHKSRHHIRGAFRGPVCA